MSLEGNSDGGSNGENFGSVQDFLNEMVARNRSVEESDEEEGSEPGRQPRSSVSPSVSMNVDDQRSVVGDLAAELDKSIDIGKSSQTSAPSRSPPAEALRVSGNQPRKQRGKNRAKTTEFNYTDEDGKQYPIQCRQRTIFKSQEEYAFIMKHFKHYRGLVSSSSARDWAMENLVPEFIERFGSRMGLTDAKLGEVCANTFYRMI